MHRIAFIGLFLLAACGLVAGCSSKGGGSDSASQQAPVPAPAPAPAPAETLTLAAVSKYDAGPRASQGAIDAKLAEAGEKLFATKGCTVCHGWGKTLTGPDLKGVVKQRTAEWMENQILHPDVMTKTDPISHQLMVQYKNLQMTNLGLTPEQAKSIVEYLKQREKSGH